MTTTMTRITTGAETWRRALVRAKARGYDVEYLTTREFNDVPISFWRVSSNSEPGNWRSVSVMRLDHGFAITCDCPAGQHDKACVHAACVLREMHILGDPDPGVLVPAA